MKIIAIGRNYSEHAKELNNPVPEEPVIFIKPDTAFLKNRQSFYIPDFSQNIHFEAEIVLKIAREGKHVLPEFALSYISEYTIGLDLTARDIQNTLKEKRLPWELAKGFDHSAPVGDFIEFKEELATEGIDFHLDLNKNTVQTGNTRDMLFSFAEIISFVSARISFKKGDLIYTGTPPGVGKISEGDLLEGFIGDKQLLSIRVK